MGEEEGDSVLVAGGTDWALIGKSAAKGSSKEDQAARLLKYPNLLVPHRIKGLEDIKVTFVAAGSAACHCIIGDTSGQCWTWGRNDKGQLGVGDLVQRNCPTLVGGLEGAKVVGGAGGKSHTVVFTAEGKAFSWGSNKEGQCGTGSLKPEQLLQPAKAALPNECTGVACGTDFTLWLCGDGKVWSCGHPQHGVLGNGTDHEFNAKDSSVKLMYAPQPSPAIISALADKKVRQIACGHAHCLALTESEAYSWGNGGYGRLGHNVQQDEFSPRKIETLTGRTPVDPNSKAACGSTSSFCCIVGPQLMAWGKLKVSGDNNMRPKPVNDLLGWEVDSLACGATTFAVAGHSGDERAAITWGHAQNGELAYGPKGKKSSANPDICKALEGAHVKQVALGIGQALFLVDSASAAKAPLHEPAGEEEVPEAAPEEEEAPAKGGKKRKAPAAAAAGKGKGKKR